MFPVEEKIGEIRRLLSEGSDVVLTAPPGSGKTTCVPPALLDEPWLAGKKIVMLEPRRLAARNCATYIASKLGEDVGGTVGYQVRLERRMSRSTRLEIVTEGLLSQRILADPELSDVGLVIFDEFHERSLQCDLSFAMALDVRGALRDDLRILVMSATLDAAEVAAHMNAAVVHAEGRMFPVETRYLGDMSMMAAVSRAISQTDGDILCFLPGEGEIRRTMEALHASSAVPRSSCVVMPLYGAMPKEEQDRVFAQDGVRKVILATSIAETSVTIPGITCVIDSGLMRRSRFSPATGMSALVTLPLTRDRAEQRRGRAGRVRPGVCYRLWTEAEDRNRAQRMTPEILEADLCSLVLSSIAWGASSRDALPWMTPPASAAWDQSVALLRDLGALDLSLRLTPKGEAMAKLPMHPRLANMLLGTAEPRRDEGSAHRRQTAPLLAAILEEGSKARETDIRRILDEVLETPNRPYSRRILQLAKRFECLQSRSDTANLSSTTNCKLQTANCKLSPTANCKLQTFSNRKLQTANCKLSPTANTLSEGAMLALAYPDRIAKNRGNGSFRMTCGRGASVDQNDPLAKCPFVVCCELDDRLGDARLFLGCPIDEGEITALFGESIAEKSICEWDRREDRVKNVIQRRLGEMVLGEYVSQKGGDAAEIARALIDGIRIKGVGNMPCWSKSALQCRARIAFLHRHCGWPEPTDDAILSSLEGFVGGMAKWRDLERLDMLSVFDFMLSEAGHDRREMERLAPERMTVPTGSHMAIHYEGDEPTVEVRLQECFGLMQTPKVAGGKIPIVMTLLSPAHRPIQITKDLAGFWREGYQLVRKDMRGRYPKHYWPEDPFSATPTRRTKPL